MALWPAKNEQDEDHVKIEIPEGLQPAGGDSADGGDAPDQIEQLCARLGQLGELLSQANRQVLAYLVDRQSKTPAAIADDQAAAAIGAKIDGLAEFCDGVNRQFAALADRVQRLQERIDAGLQGLADRLGPDQPEQSAPFPSVGHEAAPPNGRAAAPVIGLPPGDDWQLALLGGELAEHPGLGFQRQQLLAGVLQGDPGACSLLGQLLVFRSARTDKMPPLLKDIGEAYYRWQPKSRPGSDPMEEALAAWLKAAMQEAGIANTIELVEPGERFDSARHTASSRGVEITEVHGWIVLRDNGKVYTKASVAVR